MVTNIALVGGSIVPLLTLIGVGIVLAGLGIPRASPF